MKRSIYPSESAIQQAIVEWAKHINVRSYKLSDFLIKIPNEGKRSFKNGKIMKKEGLRKGVSDLFLALPIREKPTRTISISSGGCISIIKPGLWLEIKSKKGKLSIAQMEWITLMALMGYEATCVYSVDEGIQAIKVYLGMKP
jgi:hypothetical protein